MSEFFIDAFEIIAINKQGEIFAVVSFGSAGFGLQYTFESAPVHYVSERIDHNQSLELAIALFDR